MPVTRYEQKSKPIPDGKLDTLHGYLPFVTKAFGDINAGTEANRLYFIAPILISVCALFDGDARMLFDETVVGKRVHGTGTFEFVLQRGDIRVCVVQAKMGNIQQGLAEAYEGCEALADVEGLTSVYSIVTNLTQWCFSRNLDERVERAEPVVMTWEKDNLARKLVDRIAGMIYAILSGDT
ncbi:unnamed protein product [Phytophthora lilii]|uniref:Unnamed protein product n=1 Tax=Phytophthora lilii TaxID=2077276 RepID=A0A9W6TYF9_9STRA|nr:unnamed protein product [Phytophthora lilii]